MAFYNDALVMLGRAASNDSISSEISELEVFDDESSCEFSNHDKIESFLKSLLDCDGGIRPDNLDDEFEYGSFPRLTRSANLSPARLSPLRSVCAEKSR